jgi:hypothetical protein
MRDVLPFRKPKQPTTYPKKGKITHNLRIIRSSDDIRLPRIPNKIFASHLERFASTLDGETIIVSDEKYYYISLVRGYRPESVYAIVRATGEILPCNDFMIDRNHTVGNILE